MSRVAPECARERTSNIHQSLRKPTQITCVSVKEDFLHKSSPSLMKPFNPGMPLATLPVRKEEFLGREIGKSLVYLLPL